MAGLAITSVANVPNVVSREQVKRAFSDLKRAVPRARAAVGNSPQFTHWFGGGSDQARDGLMRMQAFLDSASTLNVVLQAKNVDAGEYAHVWGDAARADAAPIGQYFIYLGPRAASAGKLGAQDMLVVTLAHELSHLVIPTNRNGSPYQDEVYDENAEAKARTSPDYCSHNADNFGYFIEACLR